MTDGPSIPPPAPPPAGSSNLISRAINILTKPASEWRAIDGEATSVGKLIGGYAVLLALIAPLAMLVGLLISPFGSYIFQAPVQLIKILLIIYAISLATPVLLGFIVDALTTNLGGTKSSVQAMKLAVYSGTAFWVAAIILILPDLWWLWLVLGVGYGGYLIWTGLPILLRVPADKAPVFTAAAVGIWAVLFIVLQQIAWRVMYSGFYASPTVYGM
ncbi:MAG TPA: Yip1 family protein [Propylenella sp.]|nr:Yip1 family protein [Propylenella sp.]HYD11213.1 Yip1 family protein [Allosphingosinicella sp.]